jgi:hypothetical protein
MADNKRRLGKLLGGEPPAAAAPIQKGAPFQVSTAAAPPEPDLQGPIGELSAPLQEIARRYVGARRRSGEALLEAARWLTEARDVAGHGEWQLFLDATATSADAAERLLNIHRTAMQNQQFADAVARNWLGLTAAALLARPSTPPEALTEVLGQGEAPRVEDVRGAIARAGGRRDGGQIPQNAEFGGGAYPQAGAAAGGQIPQNAEFGGGARAQAGAVAGGQIPQNAEFEGGVNAHSGAAAGGQIPQNAEFGGVAQPQTGAAAGGQIPQNAEFGGRVNARSGAAAGGQIPQNAEFGGGDVVERATAEFALEVLREAANAVERLQSIASSLDSPEGRALILRLRRAVEALAGRLP